MKHMNSYDFFMYELEFICFMNSYMNNSGVPRIQMQPMHTNWLVTV